MQIQKDKYKFSNQAFTIVELLVVIVVIGILAAITIVSYSGISNKAISVTLQSDLESGTKQLKMYNVEHGYYPSSINANYCPDSPDFDDRYCLKASSGNILTYIGNGQTFTLTDTNTAKQIAYRVTENGQISVVESQTANATLTWKQIATSSLGACGIASDNNAYCWGGNTVGELGSKWIGDSPSPLAVYRSGVLNGLTIKTLVSGNDHYCVIASDDNVYCWGLNINGNLGNNSTKDSIFPVAVDKSGVLNGLTVKSIASGLEEVCIIASDDNAYCWGRNTYGQLGNGSTVNSSVPVMVNKTGALSGLSVKSIAIGQDQVCVIASDNNAYCWGAGYDAQLGNNSRTNSSTPVAVVRTGALNGLTLKSIYSHLDNTCVIASDNNAYCWGLNSNGNLGDGSTTDSYVPVAVKKSGALNGLTVKSMSLGWIYACAIASDDNAYCWGYSNDYGVLGNGSTVEAHEPVAVDKSGVLNGLTIRSISAHHDHVCVIASDANIYCWGLNYFGQLGNGTQTNSSSPVKVNSVIISNYDETNNSAPAATVSFKSQEMYIAYPGESKNTCKDWTVPAGSEIQGFFMNQSTENGYDFVRVSVDNKVLYYDSGKHMNRYFDISANTGSKIGLCVNTDDSLQDGFGAEITGVIYASIPLPPAATITFESQEMYIAYPGDAQTACKQWTVPNGYKIKGLYLSQATELDYDYLTITIDGSLVYHKSGLYSNKYVDFSTKPGDTIEACVSADESYQEGFGAEITGVYYE